MSTMKQLNLLAWMMVIAMTSMTMTACSSDDTEAEQPFTTDPVEKSTLYACGISESETRSDLDAQNVLFTEDDIEWFNVTTREIKFKNFAEPLYKRMMPFHEIEFRLGDQTLFSGSTFVGLICSQVFNDLVLCCGKIEDGEVIDSNRYYLYDCYPNTPQFLNDEQVKANRAKRAAQWETFTKYLESKGKLKK